MRYAFAGDRDVAVWVLDYLLAGGFEPLALLTPDPGRASHADELVSRCGHLPPERVIQGASFRDAEAVRVLAELRLDLVVAVHFPLLVPAEVLALPRLGVLNLHPAFLPYNRGWHTATWAILEGTPVGATLHFMDSGLDSGDVVHQRALEPSAGDTAHSLYAKLKRLELEVFREAWPSLVDGTFGRRPQPADGGTAHKRGDLVERGVQGIDVEATVRAGDLLRRLRALTTDRVDEAAYYEAGGRRYRLQVVVTEEPGPR